MANISAKDIGIKGAMSEPDLGPESERVQKWLAKISESKKLEKDFRKDGARFVELYEAGKKIEYQFNILYSNTETMLPALYNSTPRPVVQRRFKDEDPLGKMAARAAERTLEYLVDDGNPKYTSFDDLMKSATLEALVPGRGLTRFKYDATIVEQQNEAAAEGVEPPEGEEEGEAPETAPAVPQQNVSYETVCGEEIPWNRFVHGNAKKWADVPWGAIQHFMSREELERNFGEIGGQIPVIEMVSGDSDETDTQDAKNKGDDLKNMKVAEVWEIWDKDEKKVLFVSPQWKSGPIKEVDDPLELSGFFPWPRPLTFVSKISSLVPVALYAMYEEQAKELNRVTVRINRLISALKVRGMYDATVEKIADVLKAEDNTLVAAENVAALLANGNALEKAIWLFPIEKIVPVIQQLYLQRQQVKTVIYEITGIADIMRGSSAASETLGAQQIKNQWGTLRLKKTQKEVMRYCRDCLRIMAEIAVSKLSPKTLKGMTGLPYPMQTEKEMVQQRLQVFQQQYQQAVQIAQMQGVQPPQQPQIPPEMQQALGSPTWEDLLALLQDDIQRSYRIDIETNSTVDAEATEDKEDIGELLNAISQFLNGVAPLVENGTMPFGVAQGMLLAVVRRYRFGPELEDQLKQMTPPQQKGGDPAAAEAQKKEIEQAMQAVQQAQAELEKAKATAERQLEDQKAAIKRAEDEASNNIAMERASFEHEKMLQMQEVEFAKQRALKEVDAAIAEKETAFETRMRVQEHRLALKQAQHADQVAREKAAQTSVPANS